MLIENAPGSAEEQATPEQAAAVRRSLGLGASTPMVLYTGTFEAYQGLDLLFEAMAHRPTARARTRGCCWRAASRIRSSARAARRAAPGIDDVTIFAGERPAAEIPAYLLALPTCWCRRARAARTRR